tara:strand:- start:94 stop:294 length:201 start_codon:yes stop_codon:yes gene_type:complete
VVQHLPTLIHPGKVILEVVDIIMQMSTSMVAVVVEHPKQEKMPLVLDLLQLDQVLVQVVMDLPQLF